MPRRVRRISLALVAVLCLFLPPAYVLWAKQRAVTAEPVQIFAEYVKATYSRDFHRAYRFLSDQDRQVKPVDAYARERGSFSGFTLEVARKLSEFVEFHPIELQRESHRARIKLKLRFPDANSVSELLLDWSEDRLNSLSAAEKRQILATLQSLGRHKQMTLMEGEEEAVLVKEAKAWRVLLDWASGVRINFDSIVPDQGIIEAIPVAKDTLIQRKEPFTIAYRVSNRTKKSIFARVVHRIEPSTLARYLNMFECSLLVPVELWPGEQNEFTATYLVDGDLPEDIKSLRVTYEFKIES